ncbi:MULTISPECIES: hypothetical protein [unclassified Paraburkholderia]|nr:MULTISPECIES: hypothetical protein [unclassified Paraburkholderia]MBB5444503.1 hypothetical protein [Paraburkholderia sp. WSM4177]MBB5485328.1 hypothetical protein [Paraburkholderia sp. WSM4180]
MLHFDELRRCATLDALEQRYGFRRLDVITRWEQQSQGVSGPQSHGEGT